jgi:hypothetical protein
MLVPGNVIVSELVRDREPPAAAILSRLQRNKPASAFGRPKEDRRVPWVCELRIDAFEGIFVTERHQVAAPHVRPDAVLPEEVRDPKPLPSVIAEN